MADNKTPRPRRHILLVTVGNEPGVLARIVGLFAGRGWNIDDLAVSTVTSKKYGDSGAISRITIVTHNTDDQNAHIITQIEKLPDVREVQDLTDDPDRCEADVTLVKVLTSNPHLQTQIAVMAQTQFRAMSIRTRSDFIVLRFVGQQTAGKEFVEAIERFLVDVETSRSGLVAIA